MVQRAADRADGLQWRRALASVATDELGIGLGEALGHPAVARAQAIVGAPSYEESLTKLGLVTAAEPEPPASSHSAVQEPRDPVESVGPVEPIAEPPVAVAPIKAPAVDDPQPTEAIPVEQLPDAGAQAEVPPTEVHAPPTPDPAPAEEPVHVAETSDDGPLRLTATHLGGIATLQPGEQNLELRFGDAGLDIARRPGRVLGRLRWPEINALEVPSPRGLRRRRRQERAQLVVRTGHGDASFEIPSVTEDELRASLEPLLDRYRPA
jgi:hypothetical protein